MGTIHIEANKEEIAKIVLMPGDPLRAQFIAENYLEDAVQINKVRNMFGFTGYYKGIRVTVMSSGMGGPSMGIYSHELFNKYDVDAIIRIGSTGAYSEKLNMHDVMLVESSWSQSTYAKTYSGYEEDIVYPNSELNSLIKEVSDNLNISIKTGRIHSTDAFYTMDKSVLHHIRDTYGCLGVEMESFALLHNANVAGKKAACLLTVADHALTNEKATVEERQHAFENMIKLALGTVVEYSK
ncbi:purine-nucleoside phosphorylase [Clostridium sp. NSJ-6]|uniref:Uridine phosphorylase n=1 Tax=Clostridium hominis TaxID=2763036 RepID=A0ABR7D9X1_9CLOT|nr:purine-nucleoside phosphorylase [Clostridium hominis]MBC5628195.1 purine-nucleoside phosphorylase [Clostridium hominis]MDU2671369.1 purine-nucleoside phosphorylase [Clostridium sp.]